MRVALAVLISTVAFAADIDTDGDGLSDFQERHKYFTNHRSKDSDGDGHPDGDWSERRQYTYTVRSVVRVMHPVTHDAINDDYQDARVRNETKEYVELEVIHYPLNSVAESIVGNRDWRRDAKRMREYLAPGRTSNWDRAMRTRLLAELARKDIDVNELDDKQAVERASAWLLRHAQYIDTCFTPFFTYFPKGRPAVYPGLESAIESYRKDPTLSLEQQWGRDLFAKSMFENRTRGSCTSTAIYLNGCLRAIGVPTRIIYCIPVIDASDPRELAFLERLQHHKVRRILQDALGTKGSSWSSHTFNEVYVGGRWRRLNYQQLGQNTLDENLFGLMTHIMTTHDWADANMAMTVGRRQGLPRKPDTFGGANPYSTLELSDQFGSNANIENKPVPPDLKRFTVVKAIWYDSKDRPQDVSMRLQDPETAGHILLKVREVDPTRGPGQYDRFYRGVDKRFILRTKGHPDLRARATRGYWASGYFYVRIEPTELKRMVRGVSYTLIAENSDSTYRWIVPGGTTLTR